MGCRRILCCCNGGGRNHIYIGRDIILQLTGGRCRGKGGMAGMTEDGVEGSTEQHKKRESGWPRREILAVRRGRLSGDQGWVNSGGRMWAAPWMIRNGTRTVWGWRMEVLIVQSD